MWWTASTMSIPWTQASDVTSGAKQMVVLACSTNVMTRSITSCNMKCVFLIKGTTFLLFLKQTIVFHTSFSFWKFLKQTIVFLISLNELENNKAKQNVYLITLWFTCHQRYDNYARKNQRDQHGKFQDISNNNKDKYTGTVLGHELCR